MLFLILFMASFGAFASNISWKGSESCPELGVPGCARNLAWDGSASLPQYNKALEISCGDDSDTSSDLSVDEQKSFADLSDRISELLKIIPDKGMRKICCRVLRALVRNEKNISDAKRNEVKRLLMLIDNSDLSDEANRILAKQLLEALKA